MLQKKNESNAYNIYENKARIILSWLLKENSTKITNFGVHLIEEDDLNITEGIHCWVYNDEVDIDVLKPLLAKNAYQRLSEVIRQNKDQVM